MLRWQTLEMQDCVVCCWALRDNTATPLCRESVWPWEVIRLALSNAGSLSHTARGCHQLLPSLSGSTFSLLPGRQQTAPKSSSELSPFQEPSGAPTILLNPIRFCLPLSPWSVHFLSMLVLHAQDSLAGLPIFVLIWPLFSSSYLKYFLSHHLSPPLALQTPVL